MITFDTARLALTTTGRFKDVTKTKAGSTLMRYLDDEGNEIRKIFKDGRLKALGISNSNETATIVLSGLIRSIDTARFSINKKRFYGSKRELQHFNVFVERPLEFLERFLPQTGLAPLPPLHSKAVQTAQKPPKPINVSYIKDFFKGMF